MGLFDSFFNTQNVGIGTNAPDFTQLQKLGNSTPQTFGPEYFNQNIIPNTQGPLQNIQYGTKPFGPGLPTPAPAPQPQPQNQGGGNGFDMSLYPGWGETEARADFAATGGPRRQSPGSGAAPDYSSQINDIYNPLYSSLNDQSNYVQNTQLPQSLAQLATSTAQLQSDLEAKKAASELQQTRQQETLQTGRGSAMDEAKRTFQAMQRQAHARFGGTGSAGRAASEIAQTEFARQAGRTDQVYAQNMQKMIDYGNSVDLWTMQESRRIARESEEAKLQIQSQAQQRLLQINADKNALDSAKSSATLELVREAQNRINNLQDARTSALIELDSWKKQQDYLLEKNLASMQQQVSQPTYDNFFNPTVTQTPQSQTFQQPQYVSTSQKADEFSNLTNPFA